MSGDPDMALPNGRAHGLHVLRARLPELAERPQPTEVEIDAFEPVDRGLETALASHLEPYLGPADVTCSDLVGTVPIDVLVTEPSEDRPWGACYTVGASARAPPVTDAERGLARPRVEWPLRLPASAFHYWDGVVLEPFDAAVDAVVLLLSELARLPHERGIRYRAPLVVATPDLGPLVARLPFAGVLLRDASAATVPLPRLVLPGGGVVALLTVTLRHRSEVEALAGPAGAQLSPLVETGLDDMFDPARTPVV